MSCVKFARLSTTPVTSWQASLFMNNSLSTTATQNILLISTLFSFVNRFLTYFDCFCYSSCDSLMDFVIVFAGNNAAVSMKFLEKKRK